MEIKFCCISRMRCRSFRLQWVALDSVTQDCGASWAPCSCIGLVTLHGGGPCLAWGSFTHQPQGAVKYNSRLPLKYRSKRQRARGLPPPRSWTRWVVGAAHPPPGIQHFCAALNFSLANGALPWQTHRLSVSVLVFALSCSWKYDKATTLLVWRHAHMHWSSFGAVVEHKRSTSQAGCAGVAHTAPSPTDCCASRRLRWLRRDTITGQ